jgi:phenylacetate-CoA ligase
VEDRTLPDGTLVLTVAHDLLTTPEWQVIQALDEIELYEPDLLVVDPSHFAFLSRCARRLGREIKVSRSLHVVCGYTLMTRVARRQIEEFMGSRLPIGDMVGMSELGYLGFECHFGARHINNVDFYVEFIRDGKPVAMGEIGELYVTTLDDALLPRIRYATGDFFTPLSSRCECGTDLPRVRLEGRGVHMVQLPDDRVVTPGTIDEIVGEAPGIDLYRLEQERTGESVFRYIAGDSAEPEEIRALELRLVKALEPTPVRTEAVDYIACDRSGKFQSCVSHLSEERAR